MQYDSIGMKLILHINSAVFFTLKMALCSIFLAMIFYSMI